MPLFVAQHEHPADRCPAQDPRMGAMLLQHLSEESAGEHGIRIEAKAVENNLHRLVLILDAPDERAVVEYLAPFAQAGTVEVFPASTCEAVVGRGGCQA